MKPSVPTIDLPHQAMKEDCVAQFKSVFRSAGANGEELSPPSGFHCTTAGNLILADDFNHRIQIYDANQNLVRTFGGKGNGPGEFHYPKGISTDRAENIYVAVIEIYPECGWDDGLSGVTRDSLWFKEKDLIHFLDYQGFHFNKYSTHVNDLGEWMMSTVTKK